jgi:hypothetical protein
MVLVVVNRLTHFAGSRSKGHRLACSTSMSQAVLKLATLS